MNRTAALLLLTLAPCIAVAQTAVPEIPFDANADLLKLPAGMNFGEVAGVAVNSKRHIFVYTRTGERSTVHGATAAHLQCHDLPAVFPCSCYFMSMMSISISLSRRFSHRTIRPEASTTSPDR